MIETPVIRPMAPPDLDQIVEIDIKVLGKARPEYWQIKLESIERNSHIFSLVAALDRRVIGFIIGGVSRWEYGVPENTGWIDTIGVDPDYQGKGVAKLLFAQMAENLKKSGVETINTFVKPLDWKLLKFFNSMGFQKGDMVNLELEL